METLTDKQQAILDFIEQEQASSGIMPSTREIQEHFGFASQTAAVNHLKALERKGAIQRLAGKARAVALVSNLKREPILDIPIYGQIAAGMAETVEQEEDGIVTVDASTIGVRKGQRVFALNVRGDSMIDAGINDGDLVVLEIKEPRSGDVVAALIDGETTLKRYVLSHGRPHLKAENPRFQNLIPLRELVIQGVMVALIRKCQR
ncbi:MAG: transcriptional repressor LexA [Chthoniobacteraceae bacterium]